MKFQILLAIFYTFIQFVKSDQNDLVACNEGKGKCVPLSNCKREIGSRNVANIVEVTFENDTNTVHECHYLEICCEDEFILDENEGKKSIFNTISKDREDQCVQKCQADKFFEGHKVVKKPHGWKCGKANKNGVGGFKIHNEPDVAQFGEFPWHLALIARLDENKGKYLCGASLINPNVALTAAHCVYNVTLEELIVRAGEWDTVTKNEPFPYVNVDAKHIVIHPDFNSSNMHNDIALIFLKDTLESDVHIDTVCLPPKNFHIDENSECYASGWGVDDFMLSDYFRQNLKKVRLPLVQKVDCQAKLRSTKLGRLFKLHTSFMCAGGARNQDTCIGDGGRSVL
jgi:hypothetical protein